MKRLFIALVALSLSSTAYALPGYWDIGYGQGIVEYNLSNKEGDKVVISCNEGGFEDMEHSVDLYLKGSSNSLTSDDGDDAPIEFVIEDDAYYAPYESRTRSGENAWMRFTDALSKASTFTVFWNGEFFGEFESKNRKNTIGYINGCKPMSIRDMDDF